MKYETLKTIIEMAEFCYEHSLRNAAHSEFLKEDKKALVEAKAHLLTLKQ